ncbi:MAG: cytochrome c1 [bacterium]
MIKKISTLIGLCGLAMVVMTSSALASGGQTRELKEIHWHFSGPFGTYDKASVQRGWQVYREVCSSCHSVELMSFRNLGQKGGPYYMEKCPEGFPENLDCSNPNDNPIVKAFAAEYKVMDGPDDQGDMFERTALPSDRVPSPYPNRETSIAANGGAHPPDFSLLAKARKHGPNHIYSILTGYEEAPSDVTIPAGQYYNPYFPGDMTSLLKPELVEHGHAKEGVHVPEGGTLKMPPPLSDGIVSYEDGSPETVEQYAADVVNFMMWIAEPKMEERKQMGVLVMLYLFIFSIITYISYKKIWARVE